MCYMFVFLLQPQIRADAHFSTCVVLRSAIVTIETVRSPMFAQVSMNHPLISDWSQCPKVIFAWRKNKLFNWLI